jgi:hypothetical protein
VRVQQQRKPGLTIIIVMALTTQAIAMALTTRVIVMAPTMQDIVVRLITQDAHAPGVGGSCAGKSAGIQVPHSISLARGRVTEQTRADRPWGPSSYGRITWARS